MPNSNTLQLIFGFSALNIQCDRFYNSGVVIFHISKQKLFKLPSLTVSLACRVSSGPYSFSASTGSSSLMQFARDSRSCISHNNAGHEISCNTSLAEVVLIKISLNIYILFPFNTFLFSSFKKNIFQLGQRPTILFSLIRFKFQRRILLYECSMIGHDSTVKWAILREMMSERMNREIEEMNMKLNVSLLHKCCRCDPIREKMSLYIKIIYLYVVW